MLKDFVQYWPANSKPSWVDVWPISIGLLTCNETIFEYHQNYYCINILIQGQITFTQYLNEEMSMQECFIINENEVFLTSPEMIFEYSALSKSSNVQVFWLRLNGIAIKQFLSTTLFSEQNHFYSKSLQLLIQNYNELANIAKYYSPSSVAATLFNLANVHSCICKNVIQKNEINTAVQIYEFMKNEIHRGLNISQICDLFSCSRSHLYSMFLKEYNASPNVIYNNIKIEKAKYYLLNTNFKINKIATLCGHNGSKQFIHHFKSYMHVSPDKFRTNAKA